MSRAGSLQGELTDPLRPCSPASRPRSHGSCLCGLGRKPALMADYGLGHGSGPARLSSKLSRALAGGESYSHPDFPRSLCPSARSPPAPHAPSIPALG